MKKLPLIAGLMMAFTLVAAVSADAQPTRPKPGASPSSKSSTSTRKVSQATKRAGEIAQQRRGKGRKFPRPRVAQINTAAAKVTILMPGTNKPVTPGGRRAKSAPTAASVVNANRAAEGPRNIVPVQSRSGGRFEFQSAMSKRRRAVRLDGPPAGLPDNNVSVGSTVSDVLPRLRRNRNGDIIDAGN